MNTHLSDSATWLDTLQATLSSGGLNHIGVVPVKRYTGQGALGVGRLAPGARSIVVVGSGGPALWSHLMQELSDHPEFLTETLHPLDSCVRRVVETTSPLFEGIGHRWFFAAAQSEVHLDFRTLAVQSGLGASSRLGLVLHPDFGPWMGLRAACFVDLVLAESPGVESPCVGCPAPCGPACPGDAFPGGEWDVGTCASFHGVSERCAASCASRMACPVGTAHRYDDLELTYHYNRREGRKLLRAALGIADECDEHEGVGPHWGGWVSPE